MKLKHVRMHMTLVVFLVAGCRPANPTSDQRANATRSDHQKQLQERLRSTYRVTRPSVDRRAPLILFVSGCSGFSPPNYADRANRLVRNGYSIAYVDYLRA